MRLSKRLPAILVAVLACSAVAGAAAADAQARQIGAFTTKGAWSFWSAPGLHPPKLRADKIGRGKLAMGGYFIAANFYNLNSPTPMIGQGGPMVLNNKLQPVWFRSVGTKLVASNLSTQKYLGKPVLAWWQGVVSNTGITEKGQYVVVDQHYKQLATLTGQNGWVLSLHDFQISGQNVWVTAYKTVQMNLTPYGGPANGVVIDFAVQEYNLKTGALLGTWDALHNVPLSQSKQPAKVLVGGKPIPWDAYHGNSIQLVGRGRFLVSLRNTWAAYLVDINGADLDKSKIEWTLSGNPKASTFKLPKRGDFTWQHDVKWLAGNEVTIFDDACCAVLGPGKFGHPSAPSRGLVLKLNMAKKTGSVVAQYPRAKNFNTFFLGSTQLLGNGNVLVGWGSQPYFTEFSKGGTTLLDVKYPGPDLSYRTLFEQWVGLPNYPPSGVLRQVSKGKRYVYASWNGATRVAAWRVRAGASAKHLRVIVKKATKTNFETAIPVSTQPVYELEALGASGKVLGTSKTFTLASKPQLIGGY